MRENKKNNEIFSIKKLGKSVFARFFGFEQGLDITDEVALLHRRNSVIKNIIFISNLLYTIILFIIAIFAPDSKSGTRWIIPIASFPVTFIINLTLTKLIKSDPTDKTKQQVAMYIATFYMFLSSLLIYVRLYNVDNPPLETAAYVLIYYALVVVSLYQNKMLLRSSFLAIIVIMTLIHFFLTHQIDVGSSFIEFAKTFFTSPEFADILLRTFVFCLFYLVVYAIVAISEYMQEERKNELLKRRQVQEDFYSIVNDMFSVVFSNTEALANRGHSYQVTTLSELIAKNFKISETDYDEMRRYSLVHLRYQEVETILNKETSITYNELKDKTELGSQIAKRIQLHQKCEDIVRGYVEGTTTSDSNEKINKIQRDQKSEIILLADVYITLRTAKSYKRPYPHQATINGIKNDLSIYFPPDLMDSFIKFSNEYENIYNSF